MRLKNLLTLFTVVLIVGSVLVPGCAGPAVENPPPVPPSTFLIDVIPDEAVTLIEKNQGNNNFVILDVRTPEEFDEGHLEGAILVDFRAENFREEVDKLDKNKTYLVYCRTANRSRSAVEIMEELGFKQIFHILGGIVRWEEDGFPIVM